MSQIIEYPSSDPEKDKDKSPSSAGYFKKSDTTGGTSHSYARTQAQITKALTEVNHIETHPPTYVLHTNNCVDVCRKVAGEAGITLPDCRKNVRLEDGAANTSKTAEMSVPNELAEHLLATPL